MEFLKNIGKPYIYVGDITKSLAYNHNPEHAISWKEETLKVELIDLNLSGASFMLIDYPNMDEFIEVVCKNLSEKLTKNVERFKYKLNKILTAWNANPESFTLIEDGRSSFYINYDVLTKEEWNERDEIYVLFEKYSSHFWTKSSNNSFKYYNSTFNGYLSKEVIQSLSDEIDVWYNKELKTIKSSKFKNRIKNYINSIVISLTIEDIINYISIPQSSETPTSKEVPKLPFKITGRLLKRLLSITDGYIDSDVIAEYKKEYGDNISFLEDCELESECEGSHANDGDFCDYTVTLTLPNGDKYYAYNSHNLITGFTFENDVNIFE
jgi:hypothetical protein